MEKNGEGMGGEEGVGKGVEDGGADKDGGPCQ